MTTQSTKAHLQQTRLGRSDLRVSPIAFGTWQLGGDWGATDEPAAIHAIRYAYDRGHLREYVSAAQSGQAGLDKYLATYVNGSEESYRAAVGADRLATLTTWSQSAAAWQELFT